MRLSSAAIIVGGTLLLSACETTPEQSSGSTLTANIPQWILNPVVPDAIAAADCVKYSGNMSIDRKMATANARLALAQQIETRIEGMDKTYANRTDSNDDFTVGTTFSSVSKQITQQTLTGTRAVKSEIIDIAGQEQFCTLVTLNPSETKALFDSIIKESKRRVNPQDEKFLYEEFKAYKAQQDLAKEIERLTD